MTKAQIQALVDDNVVLHKTVENLKGKEVQASIALQFERAKCDSYRRANEALQARINDINTHRDILQNLCRIYCRSTGELAKMTVPLFTQDVKPAEASSEREG